MKPNIIFSTKPVRPIIDNLFDDSSKTQHKRKQALMFWSFGCGQQTWDSPHHNTSLGMSEFIHLSPRQRRGDKRHFVHFVVNLGVRSHKGESRTLIDDVNCHHLQRIHPSLNKYRAKMLNITLSSNDNGATHLQSSIQIQGSLWIEYFNLF